MQCELEQMDLPAKAREGLLGLARTADLLLVGELHGSQEVPKIVLGLLPHLSSLGYQGLALELPCVQRESLAAWAAGLEPSPPEVFAKPTADGRGNVQVLGLVERALAGGWQILCFDQGPDQLMQQWTDRDSFMADNLARQWAAICPGNKVVAICGGLHSRLTETLPHGEDAQGERWWPSFASWFQQRQPSKAVRSVGVIFHEGEIYNMGVRLLQPRSPLSDAEIGPADGTGHSVDLHLPLATAATFLRHPYDWRTG